MGRLSVRASVAILATLLACAVSSAGEPDERRLDQVIDLSHAADWSLDIGQLVAGQQTRVTLSVISSGTPASDSPLITRLRTTTPHLKASARPVTSEHQPIAAALMVVELTPPAARDQWPAVLFIHSRDPKNPIVRLAFTARVASQADKAVLFLFPDGQGNEAVRQAVARLSAGLSVQVEEVDASSLAGYRRLSAAEGQLERRGSQGSPADPVLVFRNRLTAGSAVIVQLLSKLTAEAEKRQKPAAPAGESRDHSHGQGEPHSHGEGQADAQRKAQAPPPKRITIATRPDCQDCQQRREVVLAAIKTSGRMVLLRTLDLENPHVKPILESYLLRVRPGEKGEPVVIFEASDRALLSEEITKEAVAAEIVRLFGE